MKSEIYISDRYFTVYGYLVSHGQLLLRSDKIKGYSENIDIIFFGTDYIQLFTMLYGVTIQKVDNNVDIKYATVKKGLSYEGNKLFEIRSNNESYIIGAAWVSVYENDLEFGETSLGFTGLGREKEIVTIK